MEGTAAVSVFVMFPVGSRFEKAGLYGASHYVEHLMFKGTKKRPNTLVLTREIDRLGAAYNAFTSKECTGYYITTASKYVETAIDILSDMLFNSKFDQKEMEREKTVIAEEIRMYRDNPLMNIENIFEELMYRGDLGRDVAGSVESVMKMKRDVVVKYRDSHYHPGNTYVVVAGKIDEKTEKLVHKYFGVRGKNTERETPSKAIWGEVEKSKRLRVEQKKTDQTQLMMGFPGFDYNDKRNAAMSVMNTILGGSMSSRLFIQVRERRGLAYMVRSGAECFIDSGYYFVRIGLEAKNINLALGVVKKEIMKFTKSGPTKKELADAKTHMRGSMTLGLEDSGAMAHYFANEVLFKKEIKTPEERMKRIEQVTAEDVRAVARDLFDFNKMRVAVIGDIDPKKIKF